MFHLPRQIHSIIKGMGKLHAFRFLEFIAVILGILANIVIFFPYLKDPIAQNLYLFVCFQCVVFIVVLTVEEFRWHRKARHAEAASDIHMAYHYLRDAHAALLEPGGGQEKYASHLLQQSLDKFAAAWSLITGASCRTCVIQVIADPNGTNMEDSVYVSMLCRNENMPLSTGPAMDRLKDNSDFHLLWAYPHKRWFVCNDLITEIRHGYKNSHWTTEDVANDTVTYHAACVWPIRKLITPADRVPTFNATSNHQTSEQVLVGYLCVDSLTRGIFDESKRYDFHLGAGFADALFVFVRQWQICYNTTMMKPRNGFAITKATEVTDGH